MCHYFGITFTQLSSQADKELWSIDTTMNGY